MSNELADVEAKKRADKEKQQANHDYDTVKSLIRRKAINGPASHAQTQKVYKNRSTNEDRAVEQNLGQKEKVTLRATDATCRKCGLSDETTKHVIYDCPPIHCLPAKPPLADVRRSSFYTFHMGKMAIHARPPGSITTN